jgi:hypothetical protein
MEGYASRTAMGVEANIYSSRPRLTAAELVAAARRREVSIRIFEADMIDRGTMQEPAPEDPLRGHMVIIGWPSSATDTTLAVDEAVPKGDKFTVDRLGREGKLGWCELIPHPFDYEQFWGQCPEERPEYESSLSLGDLAAIKQSNVRYALRSSFRRENGRLLDALSRVLKDATDGVIDVG